MTVILTSFSLAWICSICIPWGRGSNGLLSITTSFLCQNSRTSSSGEQCIISSPSPINLSSSCFTKVGHEPLVGVRSRLENGLIVFCHQFCRKVLEQVHCYQCKGYPIKAGINRHTRYRSHYRHHHT